MSGTTRSSGRPAARRPAARSARPATERVQPGPRWVRYSIFGLAGLLLITEGLGQGGAQQLQHQPDHPGDHHLAANFVGQRMQALPDTGAVERNADSVT